MPEASAILIAGIITATGTVLGALVGRANGFRKGRAEGFEEGRKHSILEFLDTYERSLNKANFAILRGDMGELSSITEAIVDNVKTWRRIQANFSELLNGLVNELEIALREGDSQGMQRYVRAILEAFEGKKVAILRELEASQI